MGVTTTYSGIGIKPETKLLGLNDKSKSALKKQVIRYKILIR